MTIIDKDKLKEEISKELDAAELSEYEACVCVTEIYDKCIEEAPVITIKELNEEMPDYIKRAIAESFKTNAKWSESVFKHRTPNTCTTIHGFECSQCHAFSHTKSRYCSDCGSFMENWLCVK